MRPRLAFVVLALLLAATTAGLDARIHGDGLEYFVTLEAFAAHGTPEVRSSDVEEIRRQFGEEAAKTLESRRSVFTTPDGARFTLHFWLYPLLCLPARLAIGAAGGNPLAAFQASNVLLALAAIYLVGFHSRLDRQARLALIVVCAVTPAYWYVRWPHPEALTWSAALVAAASLLDGRHGRAALAAAIGAVHNPPLLLVAGLAVLLALAGRSARAALLTALAALPAFLPAVFWLAVAGIANPIVARGGAAAANVSWKRTLSLIADPNLGLAAWVPGLLLLAAAGLAGAVLAGRWRIPALALTVLGMIKLCESTGNWNHDAAGLTRYAVWMIPFLGAIAVAGLPAGRPTRVAILLAAAGHALILGAAGPRPSSLRLRPAAVWLLANHASWYDPVPEVFAERTLGRPGSFQAYLPLDFVRPDGAVTKVLLDRPSCARLRERYAADAGFFAEAETRCLTASDAFYLTPAPGQVHRLWAHRTTEPRDLDGLEARILRIRRGRPGEPLGLVVQLGNAGRRDLLGPTSHVATPVALALVWVDARGATLAEEVGDFPVRIAAGETVRHELAATVPVGAARLRLVAAIGHDPVRDPLACVDVCEGDGGSGRRWRPAARRRPRRAPAGGSCCDEPGVDKRPTSGPR